MESVARMGTYPSGGEVAPRKLPPEDRVSLAPRRGSRNHGLGPGTRVLGETATLPSLIFVSPWSGCIFEIDGLAAVREAFLLGATGT